MSNPFYRATSGDPRRPSEVKIFERTAATTLDDTQPELMLLVALVCGMMALLLKLKWAAWVSLLCLISSMSSQSKEHTDYKQMISTLTFAIMGLVASYAGGKTAGFAIPGLGF
jgi:hypothetical protein